MIDYVNPVAVLISELCDAVNYTRLQVVTFNEQKVYLTFFLSLSALFHDMYYHNFN
jgi:hypothetical protein